MQQISPEEEVMEEVVEVRQEGSSAADEDQAGVPPSRLPDFHNLDLPASPVQQEGGLVVDVSNVDGCAAPRPAASESQPLTSYQERRLKMLQGLARTASAGSQQNPFDRVRASAGGEAAQLAPPEGMRMRDPKDMQAELFQRLQQHHQPRRRRPTERVEEIIAQRQRRAEEAAAQQVGYSRPHGYNIVGTDSTNFNDMEMGAGAWPRARDPRRADRPEDLRESPEDYLMRLGLIAGGPAGSKLSPNSGHQAAEGTHSSGRPVGGEEDVLDGFRDCIEDDDREGSSENLQTELARFQMLAREMEAVRARIDQRMESAVSASGMLDEGREGDDESKRTLENGVPGEGPLVVGPPIIVGETRAAPEYASTSVQHEQTIRRSKQGPGTETEAEDQEDSLYRNSRAAGTHGLAAADDEHDSDSRGRAAESQGNGTNGGKKQVGFDGAADDEKPLLDSFGRPKKPAGVMNLIGVRSRKVQVPTDIATMDKQLAAASSASLRAARESVAGAERIGKKVTLAITEETVKRKKIKSKAELDHEALMEFLKKPPKGDTQYATADEMVYNYMQNWSVGGDPESMVEELERRRDNLSYRHPSRWPRLRYLNADDDYYFRIGGIDPLGNAYVQKDLGATERIAEDEAGLFASLNKTDKGWYDLCCGFLILYGTLACMPCRGQKSELDQLHPTLLLQRAQTARQSIFGNEILNFRDSAAAGIARKSIAIQNIENDRAAVRKRKNPRGRFKTDAIMGMESTSKSWLDKLVLSEAFDGIFGIVVVINAIVMGIEYAYPETHWAEDLVTFTVLDMIFVLGLKLILHTPVLCLDAFIVVAGLVGDILVPLFTGVLLDKFDSSKLQQEDKGESGAQDILKMMKTLRALRAIRVLRMLSFFQDLWYVVLTFFNSMKPLFWTILFVLTIIFIFSMFAIALIGRADHGPAMRADPDYMASVDRFQVTVPAMVALMQLMTLDEWVNLTDPIFQHQPWAYLFFLLYISIAGFAMMNMIAATVIESSRAQARSEEFGIEVDKQLLQIAAVHLLANPATGIVDVKSFREHYQKCQPLVDLLELMCIPHPDSVDDIFMLIDLDGSGTLDATELAHALSVLGEHMQAPTTAALYRSMPNVEGRLRMFAQALEKSEEVRFNQDMKMDMWDMREQSLRTFAEMIHMGAEIQRLGGRVEGMEVATKYNYARMVETGMDVRQMKDKVFKTLDLISQEVSEIKRRTDWQA